MLTMTKMMQIFACFSLCLLQGYGEEKSNISQVTVAKSELTQTNEGNESLGAFEKLAWETDIERAFTRAKSEHKNVMIMVEDTRCKWCIKMKKGPLSDQNVQEKLQSYILLKVQRSDKETVKQVEGFTGAIPSFHFMQPNKETIETVIGYFETSDFLGYLSEIEEEN